MRGVGARRAGRTGGMDDPTEKPQDLVEEAGQGRSERTPALAISGAALAVITLFLLVGGIAFAVYLLA
jgi:hypothetical protein